MKVPNSVVKIAGYIAVIGDTIVAVISLPKRQFSLFRVTHTIYSDNRVSVIMIIQSLSRKGDHGRQNQRRNGSISVLLNCLLG